MERFALWFCGWVLAGCVFLLILFSTPAHSATLTGTVSGLNAGNTVVLSSGSNLVVVSLNGAFQVTNGGPLVVSIQPNKQTCSVSGTTVTCKNTYSVGGTISGLSSSGLVLRLNTTSLIVPSGATAFKFSTSLPSNTPYTVSAGIQPPSLFCTPANNTGTVLSSNITNISIACVQTRSVILTWTQPTQNTDGSTLTDLIGYTIFYGTDPTLTTSTSRLISSPTTLVATIASLPPGHTYYFAVASRSTSGGVGPRSYTVSIVL